MPRFPRIIAHHCRPMSHATLVSGTNEPWHDFLCLLAEIAKRQARLDRRSPNPVMDQWRVDHALAFPA